MGWNVNRTRHEIYHRGDQSSSRYLAKPRLRRPKKYDKSSSHYANYNSRFLYDLLLFPPKSAKTKEERQVNKKVAGRTYRRSQGLLRPNPVAIGMAKDDTEHATVLGGDRLNHSQPYIAADTHNHQLMTTWQKSELTLIRLLYCSEKKWNKSAFTIMRIWMWYNCLILEVCCPLAVINTNAT